ncbi:MAG TPA: DNA internalization-related competence protein ComEC/Rec2 [Polyangiales bacterium]|nr:DNA internalization-related competence protein ComEC/Rec2 [Polyangiales bacterium]
MRTPLPLAIGYFAGLGLGLFIPKLAHGPALALTCLGLCSGLALTASRPTPQALLAWGPKLLFAAALCIGICSTPRLQTEPLPPAGMARLRAEVEEVRYARNGEASARLRVLWGERLSDAASFASGVHLTATPVPLPEGAVVSVLANVRPMAAFRNASPHPPLVAAHPTRGIARLAGPDVFQVVSHAWPARLLDRLRSAVRTRLVESLPSDVEPVARAILLGDPDALEQGDANAVRAAGLQHVFAVSGMHVTLLAGLSVWLLRRALLSWQWLAEACDVPRLAAGLGVPLALSIAAFTGGAPSGWRASITTGIAWSVEACGRRPSALAVSAAACLMFGIITPVDALRPAFLLSIAATAALIGQSAAASGSAWQVLRSLGQLNWRTTLATAPLVFWSFGSLPLFGMLANLLLVPVGSLLLLLACAHALAACLAPFFAAGSGALLSVAARAFLRGAGVFNGLDPQLQLPPLTLLQGVAFALTASVWLFARRSSFKLYTLLAAVSCAGLSEWRVRCAEKPVGELRATFVDVGQGDCTIVDLPDGRVMLIDAGGNPQGGPDPGSRALLPLLAARRRSALDIVVLTHPHPDHYGGLAALIDAVPIRELWDTGQAAAEADMAGTSSAARALLDRARARGTRISSPADLCGQERQLGAATVRVIAPCPSFDPGFDANDNSMVLRIDYAGRSFLFSGDIEAHAEQQLVAANTNLRADIFKVPHHGSRTSSSEALLQSVQPNVAVISAGAWNPFGHPHPEVVERLAKHAQQVIQLGEVGGTSIRVRPNGELRIDSAAQQD